MTISNKVYNNQTFTITVEKAENIGIWVFTVGLPVVVLIICLIVFLRRKHL